MMKASVHQVYITIRNIYAPNNRARTHEVKTVRIEGTRIEGTRELNRDFNITLSIMDRTTNRRSTRK